MRKLGLSIKGMFKVGLKPKLERAMGVGHRCQVCGKPVRAAKSNQTWRGDQITKYCSKLCRRLRHNRKAAA